ncbi:hypothetical protein QFZ63_000501 [Streptomyces sp. B3I7]|nr:hypothetical protein [Streptomyces sp. B3I7]
MPSTAPIPYGLISPLRTQGIGRKSHSQVCYRAMRAATREPSASIFREGPPTESVDVLLSGADGGQAGGPAVASGGRRVPLPGIGWCFRRDGKSAGQPGLGRSASRPSAVVISPVQGQCRLRRRIRCRPVVIRMPSASVILNWAPGCGRSFRTISRDHEDAVEVDRDLSVGVRGVLARQRPDRATDFGPRGPDGLKASSPEAASVPIRREMVGSEATGPNTAGSHRSIATSARQSPPRATARATSRSILPGSWTARGFRHGARAADMARSRPIVRTVSTSRTDPAWVTT